MKLIPNHRKTLVLKDYGPENFEGYRYVSFVIDELNKIGWIVPMQNKSSQTRKNSFESILRYSKRKQTLFGTKDGKELVIKIFTDFLIRNNIERYSRYTCLGAGFADRFNRTIKNHLKKPVFERVVANWVDVLPTIAKQYKNGNHPSTRLSPNHTSLKKNEGYLHQTL